MFGCSVCYNQSRASQTQDLLLCSACLLLMALAQRLSWAKDTGVGWARTVCACVCACAHAGWGDGGALQRAPFRGTVVRTLL